MTEKKISATIKAHDQPDATWLILNADSVGEMNGILDEVIASGTAARLGEAVASFRAQDTLGAILGARVIPGAGSASSTSSAPAVDAGPPAGMAPPTCPHGTKRYVTGNYKAKPGTWQAWGCPAPKGTPGACGLEFIK